MVLYLPYLNPVELFTFSNKKTIPMRIILFVSFFFICYPLMAQNEDKFVSNRSEYYKRGMESSIQHFDSLLHQLVQQRLKHKLTESDFLLQYKSVEQTYKNQHLLVSDLAAKLAITHRQRPSRRIRTALGIVKKGNASLAIKQLSADSKRLNKFEKSFLIDLCRFVGDNNQVSLLSSLELRDSLDKIWQQKFDSIASTDTLLFVSQKMYVAERFVVENQIESAIGTLLRAKEMHDKIVLNDITHQKLTAEIAFRLATLQLQKSDIDNAFLNAQISLKLYQALINENTQPEYAAALHLLASVYRVGGAIKEADSFFQLSIKEYQDLKQIYPERYEPLLANVLQEYSLVQKYFDKNKEYDETIKGLIETRKQLATLNYPFFQLDLARNYAELGHKLMNTDVKIFLAQEEWTKAKEVLEQLYMRLPIMAGDDLCGVLYKLGGAKIALKKGSEGIPFFAQSLKVRTYLYQLAPSENQKEYLDVLTQNATLNALDKKKALSITQLDQAIKIATEMGETKRVEEIVKFKKDVQAQK
jgi:tetratricopeptide (TPR) repeat protein